MTQEEETKAQQRFLIINFARLSGAILLVTGLAVIANGAFGWPISAGYLLFVIGMFDFLVLPLLLAKRWKSPPSQ